MRGVVRDSPGEVGWPGMAGFHIMISILFFKKLLHSDFLPIASTVKTPNDVDSAAVRARLILF
jgi:hypothetical protein